MGLSTRHFARNRFTARLASKRASVPDDGTYRRSGAFDLLLPIIEGAGTTPRCCRGFGLRQWTGGGRSPLLVFRYPTNGIATRQAATNAVVRVGFQGIGRSTPMLEQMAAQ